MILTLLLSVLSGALLPLAFSPFNIDSFAFIMPSVLLFILLKSSAKKAFLVSWIFGLGFFGVGTSWVYISIHQFGNSSVFLAGLITVLLTMYLALFFATFGFVFRKFFSRKSETIQCLFAFPALWTLWEYLRCELFTGFPWLLLGYSQLATPLHGFAPVFGVFGVSFITALISGALVLLATRQSFPIKLMSLIFIFGFIGAGFLLSKKTWTTPIGKPIQVSLIQGNIAQSIKWDANFAKQNMSIYKNLTFQHWDSQLIIWPEGAFPFTAEDSLNFINSLSNMAQQHNSNIIFGVPIENKKTTDYYNGLLLIGNNRGGYLKEHLVPFGEYTPLLFIFKGIMNYFQIPMSGFTKGPRHQPLLKLNTILIAPFICYEIAFPMEVLRHAETSNILLTVSDDSWFGKSIALAQHMQMGQMRALEMGRPVLLSTNTGITAFISPAGKILQGAPINQRMVLTDFVQPMTGKTPLMRWHYYPVGITVLVLLLMSL